MSVVHPSNTLSIAKRSEIIVKSKLVPSVIIFNAQRKYHCTSDDERSRVWSAGFVRNRNILNGCQHACSRRSLHKRSQV